MKHERNKRIAVVLAAALSALALGGCGSSQSPAPAPGIAGVAGGQYGVGSCVPITGAIPFTGTGIAMNWNTIAGGTVPGSQAYGQMYVGGAAVAGQYGRNDGEGTISLSLSPTAGVAPGYGQQGGTSPIPANMTGTLQLSPVTIQTIQAMVASGQIPVANTGTGYAPGYGMPQYGQPNYGVPGYMPQYGAPYGAVGAPGQVCVSGIAMMLNYSTNTDPTDLGPYQQVLSGSFPGAGVYLYLNNSQHGYQLQF